MATNKSVWVVLLILSFLSAACAPRAIVYEKGTTIAVWDLDDLSPSSSLQPSLGELFSARVIETLMARGDYDVVEREKLILALEELQLGTTSLADENTRLSLGRLVGARLMVFGAYQNIGDSLRIDLRMVEVETGKVLKAAQKTISAAGLSEWLQAAREAAFELIK